MQKFLLNVFISIFIVFFNIRAFALPDLKCITDGFPTTSFLLTEKTDHIELRVINHGGPLYAPVYNGNATPSDIDHIKKSGEFFGKLGDFFTVKFDKDKCRIEEGNFFTCVIRDESEISGVKVRSVYFTTTESIDKIPDYEFARKNVRLTIRENYSDILEYRLEMAFYGNDCEITKK